MIGIDIAKIDLGVGKKLVKYDFRLVIVAVESIFILPEMALILGNVGLKETKPCPSCVCNIWCKFDS